MNRPDRKEQLFFFGMKTRVNSKKTNFVIFETRSHLAVRKTHHTLRGTLDPRRTTKMHLSTLQWTGCPRKRPQHTTPIASVQSQIEHRAHARTWVAKALRRAEWLRAPKVSVIATVLFGEN